MQSRCCYCKDKVYPYGGGEMQLEQVRAVLPQYRPSFPDAGDECCDMEMTEACIANISMMVPTSGTRPYEYHGPTTSLQQPVAGPPPHTQHVSSSYKQQKDLQSVAAPALSLKTLSKEIENPTNSLHCGTEQVERPLQKKPVHDVTSALANKENERYLPTMEQTTTALANKENERYLPTMEQATTALANKENERYLPTMKQTTTALANQENERYLPTMEQATTALANQENERYLPTMEQATTALSNKENERYLSTMEQATTALANQENERYLPTMKQTTTALANQENERYLPTMEQATTALANQENERYLPTMEQATTALANQENERYLPTMEQATTALANQENERYLPTMKQTTTALANQENERYLPTMEQTTTALANQENERYLPTMEQATTALANQENERYLPTMKQTTTALANRENEEYFPAIAQPFGFTPNTVEEGYYCTLNSTSHGASVINTKLNFSDFDSVLSVSSHQSHHLHRSEDSLCSATRKFTSTSHKQLTDFNVTSHLETKAKVLLQSKENDENEFAMTEFEVAKSNKPSNEMTLGILQRLDEEPSHTYQPSYATSQSSFSVYADPTAYQPSYATSQSSFSVYADPTADESSFMPYHDASNVSVKRQNNPHPLSSGTGPLTERCVLSSCPTAPPHATSDVVKSRTYGAGEEVVSRSELTRMTTAPSVPALSNRKPCAKAASKDVCPLDEVLDTTVGQFGLTQFDIKHPQQYDTVSTPVSTPAHHKPDLTFDVSVIPAEDGSRSHHFTQPQLTKHLSTITEESSGKSKLTTSSSRSRLTSSSSSMGGGASIEHEVPALEINPFLPGMVNRMFNSLGGIPDGVMEELATDLTITERGAMLLGGSNRGLCYDSTSLLSEGSTCSRYLARKDCNTQLLQVHRSGGEWEVTILHHLHERLERMSLQSLAASFQNYQRVWHSPRQNVVLTVSPYHPNGSLQDVIMRSNKCEVAIPYAVIQYMTVGMLSVVAYLHKAGIIHANISPKHFLLHNLSDPTCVDKGLGVRLIDFKNCIDLLQFPEEQLFVGYPRHQEGSVSLCSAMKENRVWKWEVDYYALAATILALIKGNNRMECVSRDAQSGHYSVSLNCRYDSLKDMLEQLLNADARLDLEKFAAQLQSSLRRNVLMTNFKFFLSKTSLL